MTIGVATNDPVQLDVRFPACLAVEPSPLEQAGTRHNFMMGHDPSAWRIGVPAFAAITYATPSSAGLWRVAPTASGLQLSWTGKTGDGVGELAFGANGPPGVRPSADGGLRILAEGMEWELTPPQQTAASTGGDQAAAFQVLPGGRVRVLAHGAAAEDITTVTTSLLWSSYFGGSGVDEIGGMDVSDGGDIVLAGTTESLDLPVTAGTFDSVNEPVVPGGGAVDAFVARYSPSGEVVFVTYLGAQGGDRAYAVAIGPLGDIFVSGLAGAGFPTTPGAFDTTHVDTNAFVSRLSGHGDSLIYSTLFGGLGPVTHAIAVDELDRATIVGTTQVGDLPVTSGAFDTTHGGGFLTDGFVATLDAAGQSLVLCTYLGGESVDTLRAVQLDEMGNIILGGGTSSSDFPVTAGAYSSEPAGGGFISVLDPTGSELLASTILPLGGGLQDVAVGPDGSIYAAGQTSNLFPGFPTTPGAFSTDPLDVPCGYVTRFTPALDGLIYSTFLSSLNTCWVHAIEVDASGVATVAGSTNGSSYSTTPGSMFPDEIGGWDFIVTRLAPDGGSLIYSTYFGSTHNDSLLAPARLALQATGEVVLAGETLGTDVPMSPGSPDPTFSGEIDLVLARLDLLPAGVVRQGSSTPGCSGPLPMGAQNAPLLGAEDFALTCSAAPVLGRGLLLLALDALDRPLVAKGVGLWVDPGLLLTLLPASADTLGFARTRLPVPSAPELAGQTFGFQYAWPDPCAPAGWSASDALRITVQP